jgi:hypothetical protein
MSVRLKGSFEFSSQTIKALADLKEAANNLSENGREEVLHAARVVNELIPR